MIFLNLFLINLLSTAAEHDSNTGFCDPASKNCKNEVVETDSYKLIFYDVNPPEGFNLRRDVYMRFAIMMADARKRGREDWQLVLPPWHKLYHWRTTNSKSLPQKWSEFFDLDSLKAFAPVVELQDVFSTAKSKTLEIDTLYVLENFENPFENGVFEEKWQYSRDCEYEGNFWGYKNVTAKETVCVKFQGKISKLWELVYQHRSDRKVMFTRGEIPLHDNYGTKAYWQCRKSMKFNKILIDTAQKYITDNLNCNTDKCSSYLSVHWRRKDFAYSRPNDVPSITGTVKQIDFAVKKHVPNIKRIFIASDASSIEFKVLEEQLNQLNYEVYSYVPPETDLNTFKEGGVAIIDQIICSRSAHFIGTHESTFSFRIQEEREILGYDSNTTFNRLCPDSGPCDKPSKWTIIN
jgi:peptide-O-fucosyltransferase